MLRYGFTIFFLICQIWIGCHSKHSFVNVIAANPIISTSSTITTTNYIVHVGSTIDGSANPAACSSSSSIALSSCNLRSAWALCQSLITAVMCPSSGSQSTMLTCAIVLPGMSTIQMLKTYGSNGLDVSGLSSWASSCQNTQVSLSIASPASTRSAIITGDSSSAPLLILQNIPFMAFTMENVTITGFGDGLYQCPGVVVLTSIQSARFAHMQIGPKNKAFTVSVISLQSFSSTSIIDCRFVDNLMAFTFNLLNPGVYGNGAGLGLTNMNDVLISGCTFVANRATYANSGAALGITFSNNVVIVSSVFVNNTVLTGFGWGGALYITSSTNISISTSRFDSNSVAGSDGAGGALYATFSSFIHIVDNSFTNNTAWGAGGKGGALSIFHATSTLIKKCTFTGNSAQEGGGIALGRSTIVDMIELQATGNTAVQKGANAWQSDGNGGFLTAQTDNLYISIVKSTFYGNSAAGSGGAFYFGSNNSFLAFTNSTFKKNMATKSGGAIYMGASNQYISFGGALPSFNQQNFEESYTTLNIPGNTLARGDFRVIGYYAVFDTSVFGTCNEVVRIGDYLGGAAALNCNQMTGWDSSHMPGMNGKSPYYVNKENINNSVINAASGWMNVVLAPVVVTTGPHGKDVVPTLLFINNQAGTGGGAVYLSTQHRSVFFMRGTLFINNAVTGSAGSGGAIYIGTQNQNIFLFANTFQGGQGAGSGGAVAILSNNFVINFYDCVFVSNTAQRGGAIFMNQNNGDIAAIDGDGIQLIGGRIINNIASIGGGIYMFWENVALLQQIELSGNVALDKGGAIFVDMGFQSLYMNSVTFSNNRAGTSGGAISSDEDNFGTTNAVNLLTLQGAIVFQGNVAGSLTGRSKGYGGALSITTSSLVLKAGTQFIVRNNTANGGSAILFVSTSKSTVSMTTTGAGGVHMLFADNVCRSEGGTVYWIRSVNDNTTASALGPLLQPTGSNANGRTLVWTNNHAPLSQQIATQPTILHSLLSSKTVILSHYGSFIRPSPSFQLMDSFGIVNSTDFTSSVVASVTSYNCGNDHIGYLSGVQNVRVKAGVATFDSLSAFCFPGGNITVQFVTQLSGFESSYSLSSTLTLNFRSCLEGEILVANQCMQCPHGSYSFVFNSESQCTPCPPNADGCSGATIDVSPGYWRPSTYSKVFLPCPFPDGCIGGNGNRNSSNSNTTHEKLETRRLMDNNDNDEDDGGCAEGYGGPLCGVCASGYYLNQGLRACQLCRGNGPGQLTTLVLIPLFLLIFAALMTLSRNHKYYLPCLPLVATSATTPEATVESEEDTSMIARFVRMFSTVSSDTAIPKLKIVVTAFQILSAFPDSLRLSLATSSYQTLRSLSYFVNLLANPGSPRCYTTRFDYIDRLMLDTIAPIVICALLPLTFALHVGYLRRQKKDFYPIVSFYVSMFLFITYAILPSVCTTIFGTFSPCVNIDPEGLLGTYSLYLPKDMSISCNSSRYHYGIVWASVMVIIYPVGIPCLYLYLLFLARAEIKIWKEKQIIESTSKTLKISSPTLDSSIRGANVENSVRKNNTANVENSFRKNNAAMENSIRKNNGTNQHVSDSNIRGHNGSNRGETPAPVVEQPRGLLAVKKPSIATSSGSMKNSKDAKDAKIQALNTRLRILSENNSTLNEDSSPSKIKLSGKTPSKLLRSVSMSVMNAANNHAAKVLSEEGIMKYIVSELEFLHRDYRANYWYWEIVLTYDKLLMTAVISIIYPGTHDQILIAWIMAFVMMRVQSMAEPYLDSYDDSIKKIADYQIILFLFIAIIKVGDFVAGVVWEIFLNIVMFFLIFSSPVAAFWYAFIAPSETVASLRKDYREQKAIAILQRQQQALEDAMSSGNLRIRGDATTPRGSAPRGPNVNSLRVNTNPHTNSQRVNNSQKIPPTAFPFATLGSSSQRAIHLDTPSSDDILIEPAGGGNNMMQNGNHSEKRKLTIIQEQSNADAEFSSNNSVYKNRDSDNSYIEALPMSRRQSTMLPPIRRGSDFPPYSSSKATQKVYVDGSMTQKMYGDGKDDHDDNEDDNPVPSATSLSSHKLFEMIDHGPNPTTLQTSIKEHLTALHVSGKELVDRGKVRETDNPLTSLLQEQQNVVESQQLLLAMFAADGSFPQKAFDGDECDPYRDNDNDDHSIVSITSSLPSPRRHRSLLPPLIIHKG